MDNLYIDEVYQKQYYNEVSNNVVKQLYDELYLDLSNYAESCIKQMIDEGYTVALIESSTSMITYTDKLGQLKTKPVMCKIASVDSRIEKSDLGNPELVKIWKSSIKNKEHDILVLYLPFVPGILANINRKYITCYDVMSLEDGEFFGGIYYEK